MEADTKSVAGFFDLPPEIRDMVYPEVILLALQHADPDSIINLLVSCSLVRNELKPILEQPRVQPFYSASLYGRDDSYLRICFELTHAIFDKKEQASPATITIQPFYSLQKPPGDEAAHREPGKAENVLPFVPALHRILSLKWSTLTLRYMDRGAHDPTETYVFRRGVQIFNSLFQHLSYRDPSSREVLRATDRIVYHFGPPDFRTSSPGFLLLKKTPIGRFIRSSWMSLPASRFDVSWACCARVHVSHPAAWKYVFDLKDGLPVPDEAVLQFIRAENGVARRRSPYRPLDNEIVSGHCEAFTFVIESPLE